MPKAELTNKTIGAQAELVARIEPKSLLWKEPVAIEVKRATVRTTTTIVSCLGMNKRHLYIEPRAENFSGKQMNQDLPRFPTTHLATNVNDPFQHATR